MVKTKIQISIIIFVILAAIFAFSACDNNPPQGSEKFSVMYRASSGGEIIGEADQIITKGNDAEEVIAVAKTGYAFIKWSDGNTDAKRHDKNIAAELVLTAQFQKRTFDINYSADDGGSISGKSGQCVEYGGDAEEITAAPDTGYIFIKWSDGNTDAKRHDKNIISELNIKAEFEFLFGSGQGTEAEPFIINSYDQLLKITQYPNENYRLGQDLDLTGISHEPLFDNINSFNGSFDGGRHTIKNIKIDALTGFPSLFGFVGASGSIIDLKIMNINIVVPNFDTRINPLCVGAVAGVSLGYLSNITVSGEIKGNKNKYAGVAIGGLVGQSQNIIENCHTDIYIEIKDFEAQSQVLNIGGLAGIIDNDVFLSTAKGTIKLFCENKTEIETTKEITIGGLVGVIYINGFVIPSVTIYGCSSMIDIYSDYYNASGGLLGLTSIHNNPDFYTTIMDCYATGNIFCAAGSAAGFVNTNYNNDNSMFYNCYATGNITSLDGTAAGFMIRGRGSIAYCYAAGWVRGTIQASGFCDYLSGNIFRSFATGNVQSGKIAAGFINFCAGDIAEECFSTGSVISTCTEYPSWGVAGLFFAMGGLMKNCYSTSNITLLNTDSAITAVGLSTGGKMINCYYAGKITINESTNPNSRLGALTWATSEDDIINCHWLSYDDSLVNYPCGRGRESELFVGTIKYNCIEEMFTKTLIDALNNESDEPVWVQIENNTPQLSFVIQ